MTLIELKLADWIVLVLSQPPLSSPRIPKLDGLRGIAVLAVVGYHALPSVIPSGYYGVDIFFSLSGYLITRQILDLGTSDKILATFFEGRIRRILPALIPFWCATALLAIAYMTPNEVQNFSQDLVSHFLFFSNLHFMNVLDYFWDARNSILLHTWSISLEEQFYILLPMLLLLVTAWRGRFLAVSLLAAASFALCLFLNASSGVEAVYFNPLSRLWQFFLGVGVALLGRPLIMQKRSALILQTLCCLILSIMLFGRIWPSWSPVGGFVVATTALLIAWGRPLRGETWPERWLGFVPLTLVGRLCLGIYIWHFPLLWFWRHPLNLDGLTLALVTLTSTVAIAALSYSLWEMPVRQRRYIRSSRSILAFLGASVAVGAALAALTSLSARAEWRLPKGWSLITAAATDYNPELHKCMMTQEGDFRSVLVTRAQSGEFCSVTSSTAKRANFLVWGDSHAWALSHALGVAGDRVARVGNLAAYPNCPPLAGAVHPPDGPQFRCPEHYAAVLDHVQNGNADQVFLVARWSYYTGDVPWFGIGAKRSGSLRDLENPLEDNPIEVLRQSLMRTLIDLNRKDVVVVLEVPSHSKSVPEAVLLDRMRRRASHWTTSATQYEAYTGQVNAAIREVVARFPNAAVMSPAEDLCAEGVCRMLSSDVPIYMDDNHLNRRGAALLAPRVAGYLR